MLCFVVACQVLGSWFLLEPTWNRMVLLFYRGSECTRCNVCSCRCSIIGVVRGVYDALPGLIPSVYSLFLHGASSTVCGVLLYSA
jgi:hypothetical protein